MATYFLSKKCLKNPVFKATPHKDCRTDAQSDCPKRRRNTGVFQGVLGKNDGKDASVCATERVARSLRGVALIIVKFYKYNTALFLNINGYCVLNGFFIRFLAVLIHLALVLLSVSKTARSSDTAALARHTFNKVIGQNIL